MTTVCHASHICSSLSTHASALITGGNLHAFCRYEACAEFMAEKHGDEAGMVVLGMLLGSRPSQAEDEALESTSPPMTQTSIVAATQKLPDGKQMDGAVIRKTLQ